MAAEAELIVERAVAQASEQWPNAYEALLCLDCDAIYRRGRTCFFCGSNSVMNLAALINQKVAS